MSKRILVVEDQPDNRQIIRDMLAGTGYEITEAEDGELILMSAQLPTMDGYEVARQIKADPALRSIPIIAVTSHALDGEEQTARAAGCDGYVPEPYSPRQLQALPPANNASGSRLPWTGHRFWITELANSSSIVKSSPIVSENSAVHATSNINGLRFAGATDQICQCAPIDSTACRAMRWSVT